MIYSLFAGFVLGYFFARALYMATRIVVIRHYSQSKSWVDAIRKELGI